MLKIYSIKNKKEDNMIKVKNLKIDGVFEAIRGMRAPMKSYKKIDSEVREDGTVKIGQNDLDLMVRLGKAGTEHRKYLRAISVSLCIDAPLFWWKEFDTYKIGTVCNSESTMHKLHTMEFFDGEDIIHNIFSMESLDEEDIDVVRSYVEIIEFFISKFNGTKDKKYWRKAVELLPSSFMQKRYVYMNMETVLNICKQRKGHKLYEWEQLISAFKEDEFMEYLIEKIL
jgi:hypothetical protein